MTTLNTKLMSKRVLIILQYFLSLTNAWLEYVILRYTENNEYIALMINHTFFFEDSKLHINYGVDY